MPGIPSTIPIRSEKDFNLKEYNSMGISCLAHQVHFIENPAQLKEVPVQNSHLILGGGSNMVLPDRISTPVLINRISGRSILRESKTKVWIEVGGGENWHEFVRWTVERNFGGIENLALIPGTVGAAPIQNIGAYGVEIADVLEEVKAHRWRDGVMVSMTKEECRFGYRDSVFKNHLKGEVFITSIVLCLNKEEFHTCNISYKALADHISDGKVTIRSVFDSVIAIRRSKLPDPAEIGNCGSFFKNSVVPNTLYEELQSRFPDIPGYSQEDMVKIPTAWLIDQCGWKGFRRGDVGVYPKQALVLVNYGEGTSAEIQELASEIAQSVFEKFGIRIEPEVNLISG